jgi:hypothetical protein
MRSRSFGHDPEAGQRPHGVAPPRTLVESIAQALVLGSSCPRARAAIGLAAAEDESRGPWCSGSVHGILVV